MTHCDMGPEPAERYVAGDMPELERTGFEEHFFDCDACFRTVQALEDARQVLAGTGAGCRRRAAPAPGRGLPHRWMAVAATLVIIAGLSVVVRRGRSTPPDDPPRATATGDVPAAPTADRRRRHRPRQRQVPAPSPAASATAPSTQGRLERWAAVTPPQYVALTTRSGQDQTKTRTLGRSTRP